jgi:membrane associated rhomboid family serine protease
MWGIMKYIAALISGAIIFVAVWFLVGFLVAVVLPANWRHLEITLGGFTANLPSLIGLIIGIFAARHTFKASLRAKTGRLYRKPKSNKNANPSDEKEDINE